VPLLNGQDAYVDPVRVYVADRNWIGWVVRTAGTNTYHYSFQSLQKWAQSQGYTAQIAHDYWWHKRNQVQAVQDGEQATREDLRTWMIENRVTVITFEYSGSREHWRINGDNLKDFQMFKVADPFSMYQRISQWVGGVLPRNANPMVEITDDKIRAHKHGFDQWSFRKPPEK